MGKNQVHGHSLTVGDWKIVQFGSIYPKNEAGWVPPPGQDASQVHYQLPCDLSQQPEQVDFSECMTSFCLFNVTGDPCEYHNLASKYPDIVTKLQTRLAEYQATAVEPVRTEDCGCK